MTRKQCKKGKIKNKVSGRCRRKCVRGREIISPTTGLCIKRGLRGKVSLRRDRTPSKKVQKRLKKRQKVYEDPSSDSDDSDDSDNMPLQWKKKSKQRKKPRDSDSDSDSDFIPDEEILSELEDSPRVVRGRRISQREKKSKVFSRKFQSRYGKASMKKILPVGFVITSNIGSGKYGSIWKLCDKASFTECYAVKMQQLVKKGKKKESGSGLMTLKDMKNEIKFQKAFAHKNLSPEILKVVLFKHNGKDYAAILMKKISTTLDGWLNSQKRSNPELKDMHRRILKLSHKIRTLGWTHGDFHGGNIAINFELDDGVVGPKLSVIDANRSSMKEGHKSLDLLQLYRTLMYYSENDESSRKLGLMIKRDLLRKGLRARDLRSENATEDTYDRIDDKYADRNF